jgi:hypothetical protein
MSGQDANQIPVFQLQLHHDKVQVPTEFDLRKLARKYLIFPLKIITPSGRKKLLLAMANPFDHQAIQDVEFATGLGVMPVQADRVEIQWLIQVHYFGRKLSPVAIVQESDVTRDLFSQLEMTTDEQKQPDWLKHGLHTFSGVSSQTDQKS